MLEELKIFLGDAAANYTEPQMSLALRLATAEIEEYCGRELDTALEVCALQIAKIKLLRMNTEGLTAQGLSGVSESYLDGYPAEIKAILNRKRKIKVV